MPITFRLLQETVVVQPICCYYSETPNAFLIFHIFLS
ncbi:hypothetical protein X975_06905, partial [Stegodyphus mimosarum]